MNLLFCIDRGFIPLLGTCVRSILKNGGYERYEAYVLHSDLTQADQAAIRRFGGERMHFAFLTVQEELFEGFPSSERYPRQIYYRLIARSCCRATWSASCISTSTPSSSTP